jgi:hypothetical protein
MKNASTITVLMIDFIMVVFLVKIYQLLKLKLIKIQYVLITLGGNKVRVSGLRIQCVQMAVNIANSLSSREVSASGARHAEEDCQRGCEV